ncbi:ATP-binding protein [Nocardia vaccinii]|uniref:ATP-binding protein n=1 Tax=Nocardia vaccinii TaxID=1822 RepID=UPI00082BCDE0|nr:ATP-binding protein [Nocardia vaccinii]
MAGSGCTAAPLHIEFRAHTAELGRVRGLLRSWLAQIVPDSRQLDDVLLAVNEACSNSIEHGHRCDGAIIHLHATGGESLRITVSDAGTWRIPRRDPRIDRGRGLPLMRALIPDTRVLPGASGTTVEFVVPLPAP